jgi:hypothetical protein
MAPARDVIELNGLRSNDAKAVYALASDPCASVCGRSRQPTSLSRCQSPTPMSASRSPPQGSAGVHNAWGDCSVLLPVFQRILFSVQFQRLPWSTEPATYDSSSRSSSVLPVTGTQWQDRTRSLALGPVSQRGLIPLRLTLPLASFVRRPRDL